MSLPRRHLFKGLVAGAAAPALAQAAAKPSVETPPPRWGVGPEGRRTADLGDGTYRNPIVPGDHPDPTVLKDGADYYMTFSSFEARPGLVIWHSTDLVNWSPIGPALQRPTGPVWAVDLVKHEGRYFIYLPVLTADRGWTIQALWADDIRGPWSEPVDMKIDGCIDPGHVVGEDGRRYLFVNGVRKIRITDDGLAADGKLEAAYSPWKYPDDWVVEDFAPEGPKLFWRDSWLYLVTAVGGTAGPPTGHMVIAARSRSVHGPWEHCPHNPLVRTVSAAEPWWSRGHASLTQGPAGDWWMIYHGYENGFRTLGRQTLLEPVDWTADGWFRARGGDLSRPLPKPRGGRAGPSGMPLSGGFAGGKLGLQWSFHGGDRDEARRITPEPAALRLKGKGASPADSPPLTCTVGDRAYEAELAFDLLGEAEAGLLLFYNAKAFVGLGFTPAHMKTFQYGEEQPWMRSPQATSSARIRLTNDANVVTFHYSHDDGASWTRHDMHGGVRPQPQHLRWLPQPQDRRLQRRRRRSPPA